MLPTDVLNTLRALSLNERPLITPLPDKDTSGKGAFELGQKVQGTIQAQVSTGVFKLRNGQAALVDNKLSPQFKQSPRPENN